MKEKREEKGRKKGKREEGQSLLPKGLCQQDCFLEPVSDLGLGSSTTLGSLEASVQPLEAGVGVSEQQWERL